MTKKVLAIIFLVVFLSLGLAGCSKSEEELAFKTINGESIIGTGDIKTDKIPDFKTINGETITGSGDIKTDEVPEFKTINGETITGSGDIKTDEVPNFKTINGETITGEGDIKIDVKNEEDYRKMAEDIVKKYQYNAYGNKKSDGKVDLIMFAGQSNSCGRASLDDEENLGYVIDVGMDKAFTYNNTKNEAVKITEPISVNGSWGYGYIPAFLVSYYEQVGRKVVTCYKSVGGQMMHHWLPYTFNDDKTKNLETKGSFYVQMVLAIKHTKERLLADGHELGNILLVWCQGESDASFYGLENDYTNGVEKDLKTDQEKKAYYKQGFIDIVNSLKAEVGLDKALIIRIGHVNEPNNTSQQVIIEAQNELGKEVDDIALISTSFAGAQAHRYSDGTIKNLMRDRSHYFLEMYNYVGFEAGLNAGLFVNSNFKDKPILFEYNTCYLLEINKYTPLQNKIGLDDFIYMPQRRGLEGFKDLKIES